MTWQMRCMTSVAGIAVLNLVNAVWADFRKDAPETVCAYLTTEGHKTGTYKQMVEDLYGASSPYKLIGKGALPNNIAYYIDGTKLAVTALKLTLNVNDRSGAKAAHAELLLTGEKLVQRATAKPLPKEARAAIEQGKKGEWKVGDATVKLSRDDFPTGAGYSLELVIE